MKSTTIGINGNIMFVCIVQAFVEQNKRLPTVEEHSEILCQYREADIYLVY